MLDMCSVWVWLCVVVCGCGVWLCVVVCECGGGGVCVVCGVCVGEGEEGEGGVLSMMSAFRSL